MYKRFLTYNRKINKKNLIIILSASLVLIMAGGYFSLNQNARITTIDKIKSILSNIELRSGLEQNQIEESQLADISSKMSFGNENDDKIEGLTEDALSLEKTGKVLGAETIGVAPKLTLKEITEKVNDISKEVTIISIQVQILVLEDISSQMDEEDLTQDELENISERINQVSEQIDSIILQAQQI